MNQIQRIILSVVVAIGGIASAWGLAERCANDMERTHRNKYGHKLYRDEFNAFTMDITWWVWVIALVVIGGVLFFLWRDKK